VDRLVSAIIAPPGEVVIHRAAGGVITCPPAAAEAVHGCLSRGPVSGEVQAEKLPRSGWLCERQRW